MKKHMKMNRLNFDFIFELTFPRKYVIIETTTSKALSERR